MNSYYNDMYRLADSIGECHSEMCVLMAIREELKDSPYKHDKLDAKIRELHNVIINLRGEMRALATELSVDEREFLCAA